MFTTCYYYTLSSACNKYANLDLCLSLSLSTFHYAFVLLPLLLYRLHWFRSLSLVIDQLLRRKDQHVDNIVILNYLLKGGYMKYLEI